MPGEQPDTFMLANAPADGPSRAVPRPTRRVARERSAVLLLDREQRALALHAAGVAAEPPPTCRTRWHGITIGSGFEPSALPAARAAPGLPAFAATSL